MIEKQLPQEVLAGYKELIKQLKHKAPTLIEVNDVDKETFSIVIEYASGKQDVFSIQKPIVKYGADGRDGIDGLPGADGEPGAPGIAGKDGRNGVDGISGKDGRPGRDGKDGKDGNQWHSGEGVPSTATGKSRDFYLDLLTGNVYQRDTTTWSKKGNIKGPSGAPGGGGGIVVGGMSGLQSIVAGENISIDYSNPSAPIISASVTGGSGLAAVQDDPAPTLGGDLDLNSNEIIVTNETHIYGDPSVFGMGAIVVKGTGASNPNISAIASFAIYGNLGFDGHGPAYPYVGWEADGRLVLEGVNDTPENELADVQIKGSYVDFYQHRNANHVKITSDDTAPSTVNLKWPMTDGMLATKEELEARTPQITVSSTEPVSPAEGDVWLQIP
jgi:hypothetical protein